MSDAEIDMTGNLFAATPAGKPGGEIFTELLARRGLRIERIESAGQASPPGYWYDQPGGEWLAVLAGAALLRFADEQTARRLGPGDWLDIAPHRRHRVEWTDPAQPTLWLAVHY